MIPVDFSDIKDGLLPSGNGALICVTCRGCYDKGAPPQAGQNDSRFICEECHRKALAQTLAKDPGINLSGKGV